MKPSLMKLGKFTPKPGDLFQWHYDSNDVLCDSINQLWSSTMMQNVPLYSGGFPFLVSITKDKISWLSKDRYYHACTVDMLISTLKAYDTEIHPRKIT